MVTVFISSPLRVFSLSKTALESELVKVHTVRVILRLKLNFPIPNVEVITLCGRYLLSKPIGLDSNRKREYCLGCRELEELDSIPFLLISSWQVVTNTSILGWSLGFL